MNRVNIVTTVVVNDFRQLYPHPRTRPRNGLNSFTGLCLPPRIVNYCYRLSLIHMIYHVRNGNSPAQLISNHDTDSYHEKDLPDPSDID
jgi:hypothetical protein